MRTTPFVHTFVSGITITVPATAVPTLERALAHYREHPPVPDRDLASDIATALRELSIATCSELARAIRARTTDVRGLLISDDRFVRVPPPPGRSPNARPWALAHKPAELVPVLGTSPFGNKDKPA